MTGPCFYFVTLFPETIHPWMTSSIIGRALSAGLFSYHAVQLRDFAEDKHRTVDDVAYGGGGGMVLKVEPLVRAVESIREQNPSQEFEVICFSPVGTRLTQDLVEAMAPSLSSKHYILICGHYEGIDQRFIEGWVDRLVSLGDFVVTGGEIAGLAFADALIRQIDGTVTHDSGGMRESFRLTDEKGNRLLEYPHYTRPSEYRGRKVPEVLLGGNHQAIDHWRLEMAKALTYGRQD